MLGLDAKRTWSWKWRMCGSGIFQRKLFGTILRGSRCLAGGLSWNPLKVLLYDDLVGVVTSHVTKMAITPLDPPWPKPPVVRTNHGSVFYFPKLLPIKVFPSMNREFRLFIAKNCYKYYIFLFVPPNRLRWYRSTFSGTLSTVLACM